MRERLFRGERLDNGEWIEGWYAPLVCNDKTIIPCIRNKNGTDKEVIPETVGQFTGLVDKNGKNIFENGYIIIDNKTYKVTFNNAEYILTNIFNCDTITLKNNSSRGVFVDEIWSNKKI